MAMLPSVGVRNPGVVGGIAGSWIAERPGKWWAYFGSGTVEALALAVMAARQRTGVAWMRPAIALPLENVPPAEGVLPTE